ncbi:YgaP family membrane protein [Sphingobacterium mizutaii]|uniref:YgaP family membrane protein n=1 Tax=Sphingobacterium mizutaii TaxID=1010 RepID=UPI003D963777
MKTNMGPQDKTIRIIIAVIIAVLFFTKVISGTLAIVLMVVAGVFVLTSLIGFCPLYSILGISTCKRKATNH